ncbi:hypothetical protein KDX27_39070 [Burkholderia cenocepacia]|uniref:hypothetical protein n=1 Tax=Burkholderia cenocepacia TaxID=95486 RepID=UPI001B9B1B74|nr:hypothetical protein [Burkholderia cenocepacia]MBR8029902.1 hypothetical protein [Burkholderia cenocepacia]MBR8173694.1 hypothetical protein [Burkholderia cenocepacia]
MRKIITIALLALIASSAAQAFQKKAEQPAPTPAAPTPAPAPAAAPAPVSTVAEPSAPAADANTSTGTTAEAAATKKHARAKVRRSEKREPARVTAVVQKTPAPPPLPPVSDESHRYLIELNNRLDAELRK